MKGWRLRVVTLVLRTCHPWRETRIDSSDHIALMAESAFQTAAARAWRLQALTVPGSLSKSGGEPADYHCKRGDS